MKKHLFLAALAGLLWIGSANAGVAYEKLKEGRIYAGIADSSAVVNVSGYDRMWLDFIVTRPDGGTQDSTVVLFVSVKEVLPLFTTASHDTLTGASAAPADTGNWLLPSVVTDSTTVRWMPSGAYRQSAAASAAADTIAYNSLEGSATLPNSSEIRIRFAPPVSGLVNIRRVRVELVNTLGVPFRALYAQFKWRSSTFTDDHLVFNLRVVLGGEAW
jgi:hypothetical protein